MWRLGWVGGANIFGSLLLIDKTLVQTYVLHSLQYMNSCVCISCRIKVVRSGTTGALVQLAH